jgi:hypothetical protein
VRLGCRSVLSCIALGAALAAPSSAKADLAVDFYVDNVLIKNISFTGDGTVKTLTSADVTLPDFTLNSLFVSSNSGTNSAPATLIANAQVSATQTGHTLEIDVSDDHFTFPAGGNYLLSNRASDTGASGPSDTHTFQSFATPGMTLFGKSNPTPIISFNLAGANASPTTTTKNFSSSLPYTLTNVTTYSRQSTTGTAFLSALGTTSAAAVPEPSPLALVSLSAVMVGLARRFFRRLGKTTST